MRISSLRIMAALAGLVVFTPACAETGGLSALKNHDVQEAVDITADRLEVRTRDDVAVFEGRVRAEQGDMILSADRVTVYYQGNEAAAAKPAESLAAGDKPPAISRIDAAGNVRLQSPSETATGSWGVYDMEKRIITMGGAVQLTRGETTVKGDRMQVDLASGVTRMDAADMGAGGAQGRVRGRFTPPDKKN